MKRKKGVFWGGKKIINDNEWHRKNPYIPDFAEQQITVLLLHL